eukprot:CAMPEP_0119402818 /NCGR_PEP_ID=MMETSP1334-20130426/143070_1 /TAXON_ID=127549 /ORGANISM="Calcidiscus leptoporus, Strain RCC1130" /LENGTH=85 /DNA_ID=CAMNT_0007426757 /DNA_START=504 /DNA_END=761 /DNA_ORIENTATION=-
MAAVRAHARRGNGQGRVRGVRVYSFSPFETKAFGGIYYEVKKKVMGVGGNLASAWSSFWPATIGLYVLVKWAEWSFEQEQLKHRD